MSAGCGNNRRRRLAHLLLFLADVHGVAYSITRLCRDRRGALGGLQLDATEDGKQWLVLAAVGDNWHSIGAIRRLPDVDREEVERRLWQAIADVGEDG